MVVPWQGRQRWEATRHLWAKTKCQAPHFDGGHHLFLCTTLPKAALIFLIEVGLIIRVKRPCKPRERAWKARSQELNCAVWALPSWWVKTPLGQGSGLWSAWEDFISLRLLLGSHGSALLCTFVGEAAMQGRKGISEITYCLKFLIIHAWGGDWRRLWSRTTGLHDKAWDDEKEPVYGDERTVIITHLVFWEVFFRTL